MEETKNAAVAPESAAQQTKTSMRDFFAAADRLKELDLSGVEPIVYPTWKAERYK